MKILLCKSWISRHLIWLSFWWSFQLSVELSFELSLQLFSIHSMGIGRKSWLSREPRIRDWGLTKYNFGIIFLSTAPCETCELAPCQSVATETTLTVTTVAYQIPHVSPGSCPCHYRILPRWRLCSLRSRKALVDFESWCFHGSNAFVNVGQRLEQDREFRVHKAFQ